MGNKLHIPTKMTVKYKALNIQSDFKYTKIILISFIVNNATQTLLIFKSSQARR